MSLGDLPHLPIKAKFMTAVDPHEQGSGDFLIPSAESNSRLLGKSSACLEQDGHLPIDNILSGQGCWDHTGNEKDGQIQKEKTERLQHKRTQNLNDSFLPVTQLVNNGISGQHFKTETLNNNVDEEMEKSPVTRAIIRGEHSLVLESLRQGENPNLVCSKSGQNFLHIISWHASSDTETVMVPMVYQLSNAGIDLNHLDKSGLSAARVAIRRKLIQVLTAVLKCGAVLGVAELEEAEHVRGVVGNDILEVIRRFHPGYWEAVLDPNSFKVSRLVKAWARINISRPGESLTLIEFAKKNAQDEAVVKLLLLHEVSIELAHAVMAGDTQRVRVLLCNGGADLLTVDFSVRSAALHSFSPLSLTGAAEKYGHSKVLRLLHAKQANIPKSGTCSPVRDSWSNHDGLTSKRPSDHFRVDDRLMTGPPTSTTCTIL